MRKRLEYCPNYFLHIGAWVYKLNAAGYVMSCLYRDFPSRKKRLHQRKRFVEGLKRRGISLL